MAEKKFFSRRRRKVCYYCKNNTNPDYKDPDGLRNVLKDGKIMARRTTGLCLKHQRRVTVAVKRSRLIALLPFKEQLQI